MRNLTYRAINYQKVIKNIWLVSKTYLYFESHHLIYWYFPLLEHRSFEKAYYKTILFKTARYPTEHQQFNVIKLEIDPSDIYSKSSYDRGKISRMAGNGSIIKNLSSLSVKMPILIPWKKKKATEKDFKQGIIQFQVRIYLMIWNVSHFVYYV